MRSRLSLRSLISSTVGGTCRANAHEMILARFLLRPGRRLLEERIHLLQVTVADVGDGLQDSERRRAGQPGEPVTSRASRRGLELVAPVSLPLRTTSRSAYGGRCRRAAPPMSRQQPLKHLWPGG